jgi:hypothetical protein
MQFKICWLAALVAATLSSAAQAAVSADEAAQLGTTLTPVGAIKAGNADGSIPAFEGALPASKYPSDYKPNSGRWTDPYRNEKLLYTVTAANMAQYADKLNEGAKDLLKRFSTYEMRVYPTHRDATFPQFWLDKSIKNATTARLAGNDGDAIEGAWGGAAFPIPKNGLEAMWNYRSRYFPPGLELRNIQSYVMDSAGARTMIATQSVFYRSMWSDPQGSPGPWLWKLVSFSSAPARVSGQIQMRWDPSDYRQSAQTAWAYTPGQRRVRLAPEATYDTPASVYGGVIVYDEIELSDGRFDRFDWKLVGRKEILIPYHTYALDFDAPPEKVMGPKHPNPEYQRWELHRVWVVESTLKPGARHIYSKRNFYLDEDSWNVVATEAYDQGGKLYRLGYQNSAPMYGEKPYAFAKTATYYDFNKGAWAHTVNSGGSPKGGGFYVLDQFPANVPMTAEGLSSYGVR